MADSLVYIPDISGFTDFVNNTEITHAQHIISELLEIIIDSNQIGMKVSEIEGDAVLFYKLEEVPSIETIIDQSEKIFIAFHKHLVRYESERICQCGACSTAHKLSLKIIAHSGKIGFTSIKNQSKPFGPTLIEAHQLLKNSIRDNEYLLMTDLFKQHASKSKYISANSNWIKIFEGEKNIGDSVLNYIYIPLSDLHSRIPPPSPPEPPPKISNPVVVNSIIERPLYLVFEIVSNLDFRLTWNKNVRELVYEQGKTNRVGTKHRCLFNNGFADFETITNEFGDDSVVYGEKIDSVPIANDVSIYYVMKAKGKHTELKIEFHYHKKPYWGWLLVPLIRAQSKSNITKAMTALKDVCESTDDLIYQAV